jgi:plastocyanin domain-containing protein
MRRTTLAPLFFVLVALAGCGKSEGQPASAEAPLTAGTMTPEGRVVTVEAGDKGFSPATIQAKKGEKLILRFNRTTQSECLKAIAVPSLEVKKDLPVGQPVDVPIATDKEGKVAFQCWMGMAKGAVVVN